MDQVKLIVQEPVMKKRGTSDAGKPWELWSFKAVTPDDGRTHTIRTFWKNVDKYNGKEIVGTIESEQKQLPDGKEYTSRTFRPDPKWEIDQHNAGSPPAQPAVKTGTQVLKEQQKHIPAAPGAFDPATSMKQTLLNCTANIAARILSTIEMSKVTPAKVAEVVKSCATAMCEGKNIVEDYFTSPDTFAPHRTKMSEAERTKKAVQEITEELEAEPAE